MKKIATLLLFFIFPCLLLAESGVMLLLPQGPVNGMVLIEAMASDSGCGVRNVQLFLDGVPLGPSLTTAPYTYSWDSTTATEGSHELRALAYDKSGGPSAAPGQECNEMVPNVSAPAIRMIDVDNIPLDTTPPTILITTPVAEAEVSGRVRIEVAANDPSGVDQIKLFIDNQLRSTATNTDEIYFRWNSNPYKGQSVLLRAEALDLLGNGPSVHEFQVQVKK